tara:strand:+ start:441 stop:1595 length:1155 start_codon:yes stop_codon:yes gene_type:complete
MKNFFTVLVVLILFSCSSNPKITTERNIEQLLIEKPSIDYKLKSLPKDINVVYFSASNNNKIFPDEVKGFLTNYYSFAKQYKYFPNISFIDLRNEKSCSFSLDRSSYNFIFLLEETANNDTNNFCLNRFTANKTLIVSDFKEESISDGFRKFLVSRNEDRLAIIRLMDSYSDKIIVIDNEATKDKYEIGKIWEKQFYKEVVAYKTLNSKESSQDIFYNLLLLEQSNKRKRKLSRIISKDLAYKLRTREDIDTLFLSVNIQEARSLKPALDYNYDQGMKVFLLNDWQGDINFERTDKDLIDVISVDIPFMLPTPLPEGLKALQNKTRNFAIGYDAFEVVLLTEGARNLNKTTYKGLTGNITFEGQLIIRKPTIFRIQDGIYEYLN